jgi:tetratricopeptide (TPR) repeat protein
MPLEYTPRGFAVTTASPALALAVHAFEEQVLDYGSQAGALLDALPLDADCGLAHAYAAALHLFRATREGHDRAMPLADHAARVSAATARERGLIAAIGHWVVGNISGATDQLGTVLARDPGDLFAAKLLQHLLFSTGDAAAMLRAIGPTADECPSDARVGGMRAFALDQCGRHRDAEAAARAALDIAPDPWAHHALAHVLDEDRRFAEGQRWMVDHADAWANCTSFLYTHNWWHAALFHLGMGDNDGALALYHERVWAVRKDYVQDQVNAVSLLARLELAGVDVGDRWEEVATWVKPRRADAIDGFLDLHYAYALARAGDAASIREMMRTLAASAHEGPPERGIALTACLGVAAFGFGDHRVATARLGSVETELPRLGGSTVQRRLFVGILEAARAEGRSVFGRAA